MWEEHEFSFHRFREIHRCGLCKIDFGSLSDYQKHIPFEHRDLNDEIREWASRGSHVLYIERSISEEQCPLCHHDHFENRKAFATHVGRYLEEIALVSLPASSEDDDDEEEEDASSMELDAEAATSYDFKEYEKSIKSIPLMPRSTDFEKSLLAFYPKVPVFLAQRIADEQVRRVKKLTDFSLTHRESISKQNCPSGRFCTALGGGPGYLSSNSRARESNLLHSNISTAGVDPTETVAEALTEEIIVPESFPSGVPMPPVGRLPAEFECPVCLRLKKIIKPSDWTKHIHEDIQPFTCTFETCADPKSFKRKADWVRHENERHRQLEWWMCNMENCSRKTYRPDSFVQHLVREHGLPEPMMKTQRLGKPFSRGQGTKYDDDFDIVWKLVDKCRQETQKRPRDEPCKFCGNICNTWKKLTVHLAKHMEQISLPLLSNLDRYGVAPIIQNNPLVDSKVLPTPSHFDLSNSNPRVPRSSDDPYNSPPMSRSNDAMKMSDDAALSTAYPMPTQMPAVNLGNARDLLVARSKKRNSLLPDSHKRRWPLPAPSVWRYHDHDDTVDSNESGYPSPWLDLAELPNDILLGDGKTWKCKYKRCFCQASFTHEYHLRKHYRERAIWRKLIRGLEARHRLKSIRAMRQEGGP